LKIPKVTPCGAKKPSTVKMNPYLPLTYALTKNKSTRASLNVTTPLELTLAQNNK